MTVHTSEPTAADNAAADRVIYRQDFCRLMNVESETVRRWMKAGKLPKPDVQISQKTMGWRLSTLHAAGIGVVLNPS